ncbi:glycosyl hydrolase family 61 [Colletotrichum paranaense]|uniref:lytic cellulose monooxygenase (C4-dehydrogenating) n=1 Tax=Colletotrichum paranaense TaxID=1914294 RepID=A0ABQ9T785_9PEZI|nr:glycosyl hydrolase family 61 [Colletotrichum paranaense]KAK1547630.1 glycosyl hydrolase family 61 [Colletotrichum paranaense]
MKFSPTAFLAVAVTSGEAHSLTSLTTDTFGRLVYGGTTYPEWQHVRKTLNFYTNGPADGVSSTQIRCYEADAADRGTVTTLPVSAGSTIGFAANGVVGHPGPASFYMAKVPTGQTAATWDGSGAVWFKIYHERPTITSSGLEWASTNTQVLSTKIPACIPSGEYLVRVEHLALHGAATEGGAQFYLACAQVSVSGGGSTSPSGLVSFPGAYKSTDPGILFQPYWPTPTSYTNPGPAPFSC